MDTSPKSTPNIADSQLMMLPLSGVTERFGTEGLYKRFSLEIANYPIEEQYFCNKALYVASFLHRHETYKGLPYVTHLLRTSIRLIHYYDVTDPEVISAMLLHDSVEDYPDEIVQYGPVIKLPKQTIPEQAASVLGLVFTERVAKLVKNVTNEPTIGQLTQEEKDQIYQAAVADKIARLPETFLMKLSDFTDNAVGILWSEKTNKMHRLATKYLPVFDTFLIQLSIYEQTGALTPSQVSTARQQLLLGKDRCAQLVS